MVILTNLITNFELLLYKRRVYHLGINTVRHAKRVAHNLGDMFSLSTS